MGVVGKRLSRNIPNIFVNLYVHKNFVSKKNKSWILQNWFYLAVVLPRNRPAAISIPLIPAVTPRYFCSERWKQVEECPGHDNIVVHIQEKHNQCGGESDSCKIKSQSQNIYKERPRGQTKPDFYLLTLFDC